MKKYKEKHLAKIELRLDKNDWQSYQSFQSSSINLNLKMQYYAKLYNNIKIKVLMADDKEKAKGALKKAIELKPDDKDIKKVYEAFFN